MIEISPYHFADRLFFAGTALLACLVFGSLVFRRFFALPALGTYLRRLLLNLEQKLNRSRRSDSERKARGAIVLLTMILLTGMVAAAFSALTAVHPLGWGVEVFLLALFIPARLIYDEGKRVFRLLQNKQLKEARQEVHLFSLQDTQNLGNHGVIRATIEYMASGLAERVISPLLWYVLLGLPGFVASKIITEAALVLAHDSLRHRSFGSTAGALERILNYFPARLAALSLIAAAVFVPKSSPRNGMACLMNAMDKIRPPRKGAPIAASAGILGISLGGPRSVQGFLVKDGWVGSGSAKASLPDLRKNLFLYAIACLLNIAVVAILLFALAR